MGTQPLPSVATAAALDGSETLVLIQGGEVVQRDIDVVLAYQTSDAPAVPDDPTLTQVAVTAPDGTVEYRLRASWTANSEPDLIGYVAALDKNSGGYSASQVESNFAEWPVQVGDVCNVKLKAVNKGNLKSAFSDPPVARTITGDTAAPGVVTSVSSAAKPKGIVSKATAPNSANFAGVQVYVKVGSDDASTATALDYVPGKPGKKVAYTDDTARSVGDVVYTYFASVSRSLVESATRTRVCGSGGVTYAGVKTADLEAGAVDATALGTGAVTSGKLGSGAVGAAALAAGGVGSAALASGAVTAAKLGTAAVDLSSGTVTGKDLTNIDPTRATKLDGVAAGADVTGTNYSKGGKVDTSATGTNVNPSVYRALGAVRVEEQKTRTALGVTGSATDGVLTTKVTSTSTGAGTIHQEYISSDGRFKRRNSSESAWTAWKQAFDQEQLPSLVAGDITGAGALAQKSTIDSGALVAAGVIDVTTHLTNKSLANIDSTAATKLGGIAAGADVTATSYAKGTTVDNTAPTTNSLPSVYRAAGVRSVVEKKARASINSPGPSATYGLLETRVPGPLTTDGKVIQIFESDDGRFRRKGAADDGSWSAWKKTYDEDNPPVTTDLTDAGKLAQLNPNDLTDYPSFNVAGGSVTLLYGTDKPGLNVKNTGGDYTVTLTGGTNGDAFLVSNQAASTGDVVVIGVATTRLNPGQEGVFIYTSTGFVLRFIRVLCDSTTRLVPVAMLPVGTASGTVAAGNDSRITGAAQKASANAFSGNNTHSGTETFSNGVAVTGGMINVGSAATLTIASGAITVTKSYSTIDTEGGAASDDLDTINNGTQGDIIILKISTTGHTVVLKDGTGNLQLAGNVDCSLVNVQSRITLMFQGISWFEVSRSIN